MTSLPPLNGQRPARSRPTVSRVQMATPTQAAAEREQNRTPRKSPNVDDKENENAAGENSIYSKEAGTPSSVRDLTVRYMLWLEIKQA